MIYPENIDGNNGEFPMINDNKPLIDLLLAGKEITNAVIGMTWHDDHCDCLNVTVTVEGGEYGVSLWWLTREGVRMCYHAESGKKESLKELTNTLIELYDELKDI